MSRRFGAKVLQISRNADFKRNEPSSLILPFSTFEELPPTALRNLGDGRWGGVVVLPTAEDWFVVFEAIAPDGETTRSDTTTLVELGVDPVVVSGEPEAPVGSSIPTSTWWLIIGAVVGIAALAALAWWTFSPDGGQGDGASADGVDGQEPES